MKKITLLLCLGLLGCSGSNNPQTAKNTGFEFQPVDLTTKVPRVDIHHDDAIVQSAGVPVKKVIDSTDSDNQPKKIYQFAETIFGTQVELSKTQMILSWIAVNDTDSAKAKSIESIKIAQKIARAVLGDEGGKLVDQTIQSGKGQETTIDGHSVMVTDCVMGTCLMHIER